MEISARHLGESLKTNASLTHLDVGFNSFGKEGGIAIGDALATNHRLQYLDLSNNDIRACAAFSISVALIKGTSALEKLIMNGNPIGKTGGRSLLRVLTRVSKRDSFKLSMAECNFPDDKQTAWYDPHILKVDYSLDLADPYEFSVARDLLPGHTVCFMRESCELRPR